MSIPHVTLNDGYKMPSFGLGTYALNGAQGEDAIKYAIDIGYRLIDTAFLYKNEREVGNAVRDKIRDKTVKREELFITTKLNIARHSKDEVVFACKESLENLGLDYIDLFLIHTPISWKYGDDTSDKIVTDIDYVETWRGMEECKKLGLVRSIGISNFNSEQITRLISKAAIKPANHQIEVNLNLNQESLIKFCQQLNISVTGFSPLGKPSKYPSIEKLWSRPEIQKLSEKYGKTPAQISLRFVLQMGAVPIPKSATMSRIKENINIFDFTISNEDMDSLKSIGSGIRNMTLKEFKDAKYYPFSVEL